MNSQLKFYPQFTVIQLNQHFSKKRKKIINITLCVLNVYFFLKSISPQTSIKFICVRALGAYVLASRKLH